jgi:GTPase SAR1 family protein
MLPKMMRSVTWRSLLYGLAYVLFAIAAVFLALTFFAWFATEPGIEPLNALAGLAVSTLGAILGLLKARTATDTPIGEYNPTPAQRARNRQAMLQRVRDSWIKGVLEQSLYNVARIELSLEEQPDAVEHPWNLIVQEQGSAPRSLPHGVRMSHVFDELGQALLILGAPGAGKTTLLLELANDLLDRAEQDADHPIPVVFNLSSWAVQRKPLVEWVMDELNERYDVPKKLARVWVKQEAILPLLDGLDEVAAEHRAGCTEAINAYRLEHGLVPMAVCSRTQEFEALGVRLRLLGAVAIEPLTCGRVDAYLEGAGTALAEVREALAEDETLYDLLDTPLMLSVATLAYKGKSAAGLQAAGTIEEQRDRLFAAYVETMHERRGMEARYTRAQTERWLAWLAGQMHAHEQSVFLLERMQPDWLSRQRDWRLVIWGPATIGMVVVVLVGGLGSRLFGGLIFILGALLLVGISSVLFSVMVGETIRISGGGSRAQPIQPAETLHWSWPVVRRWLVGGMLAGLAFGLGGLGSNLVQVLVIKLGIKAGAGPVGELIRILVFDLSLGLVDSLELGLVVGLFVGLAGGLVGGLVTGEMTQQVVPNEGMRRSARSAVISALVVGPGIVLVIVLPSVLLSVPEFVRGTGRGDGLALAMVSVLILGLGAGLVGGLEKGGRACLGHLALRYLLVRNDLAPWKYVAFLDYTTERIFLRKVGGGYIFIHRLLQDYFAELWEREYGGAE